MFFFSCLAVIIRLFHTAFWIRVWHVIRPPLDREQKKRGNPFTNAYGKFYKTLKYKASKSAEDFTCDHTIHIFKF